MRIQLIIVVTLCLMALTVVQAQDWEQLGGPKGGYLNSMLQTTSGSILAWHTDGGFVRSTDEGRSWGRMMREMDPGFNSRPVNAVRKRDNVLFAEKFPFTSIYISMDDGVNWDSIPAPGGAQLLTVTPEHEIIVLVGEELQASSDTGTSWRSINLSTSAWVDGTVLALGVEDGGWFVNLQNQGLFRSTDRGVSWERIVEGITDARNEALVLIDDDRLFSCMHDQLRLSTDGGDTWENCIGAVDRIRGIVRRDHYYLVAYSWDTIYRSTDQGFSWATMTTPDMEWIYQILALDDGTLLANADNRLLRSTDAGLSWTESMDGLYYPGSPAMLDTRSDHLLFSYRTLRASNDYGATWRRAEAPDKSGLVGPFLFAGDGSMYAFSLMGDLSCRVYRSMDEGVSWSIKSIIPSTSGLNSTAWDGMTETNEGLLYADSKGLILRSTDAGATWNPFGDLKTSISTTAGSLRKLLALPPPHGDIVFSGHWNGLFRSTNGGEHWNAIFPVGGTTPSRCENLLCTSDGTVFALTDSALFRSTDLGASWLPVREILPTIHPDYVLLDAHEELWLYQPSENTATTIAVLHSADDGDTWEALSLPSLPAVPEEITGISFDDQNRFYVSTWFDGAFRLRTPLAVRANEARAPDAPVIQGVYPQPLRAGTSVMVTVRAAIPAAAGAELQLCDISGRRLQTQSLGRLEVGVQEISARLGALAPGSYMLRLVSGSAAGSTQVIVLDR